MTLHALDGEIGSVDEILFDDEHWTVRYLVVRTGSWLSGRNVLISPLSFEQVNWDDGTLHVSLTRQQVQESPAVNTDLPVSRQWETEYFDYYSYPYYWPGMGGMGMNGWGNYWYPGLLSAQPVDSYRTRHQHEDAEARNHYDAHLRSTKEVTGYGIYATDGHLGRIEDFIVNDDTWRICYLAVDTREWLLGKTVLLPPDWIGMIEWPDQRVTVGVTREQVQNAPEWDTNGPISRDFEERLYTYYARQPPGITSEPNKIIWNFLKSKIG